MVNLVPEIWQDPADPARLRVFIFDKDVPSVVPILVIPLDEAQKLRNKLHKLVTGYASQYFGNDNSRKNEIDNFKKVPVD